MERKIIPKFSKERIAEYERSKDQERKEIRYHQFVEKNRNLFYCLFFACFPCIFHSKVYENNQISPD